jgi:endonuclease G, mitochondrial
MSRLVKAFLLAAALGLGQAPALWSVGPAGEEKGAYPHLRMGNPSKAGSEDKNNFLMKKTYFALSYNNTKGTPNWVSWRLQKDDLGDAPRKQVFDTDTDLPDGFKKVTHKDYVGSGFDRGHMCPHSDRSSDEKKSFATFVMTNIIPQAPQVNQKTWEYLESYSRSLVEKGQRELYIVAGPAGKGGRGKFDFRTTIAKGKVVVPAKCWKVILVLKPGADKVDQGSRVIAVIMPNDNNIDTSLNWSRWRVALKDVEDLTGYTFFDRAFEGADADLLHALREEVDGVPIPPPTPHH